MNGDLCQFAAEQHGDVLVLAPTRNLGDLDLVGQDDPCRKMLDRVRTSTAKHLLVDLGQIEYFGSTALGVFIQAWKTISGRGGKMVICNASENERAIFANTKLDTIWPFVDTREEGLALLASE